LFLGLGAVAVVATAEKDYPREQPIVFRLADTRAASLTASFTKVGEAEARTGFTLAVPDRAFRDVTHKVRVPNGDYIVTVEVRHSPQTRPEAGVRAGAPTLTNGAPTPTRLAEETSVSRRVSLSGSEVVVSVPARASE
jgi:hypothetical protein